MVDDIPFSRIDMFNLERGRRDSRELSEARFAMVATTIPSLGLVIIGGGNLGNYTPSARIDLYNHTEYQWSQPWNLSQARFDPVATSVGNFAFFAGGYTQSVDPYGPSDVVDIYDASTNQWEVSKLSEGRGSFIAASVGVTAMFAGGKKIAGVTWDVSDVVDIFDTEAKKWLTPVHLSQARYGLTATTVNQRVIFASGATKTGISTRVDIFNYASKLWESNVPEFQEGSIWSSSVTFQNLAYIIGGDSFDYSKHLTRIEVFNDTDNKWSQLSMPIGRSEISSVIVNDAIVITGYLEVQPLPSVDVYTCPFCLAGQASSNGHSPCYVCPKNFNSTKAGATKCDSLRRKGKLTEMIIVFAIFIGISLIALAIIYLIHLRKQKNARRWQGL
jgi:hypothetical protein